jgi:hypothetical protein
VSHESSIRVLTAAKALIYSLSVTPGCFADRRAQRDEHVRSIALGGEKETTTTAHLV